MTDLLKADFKEWKTTHPEYSLICCGMQHRKSGLDHGIARAISSEGSIHERTMKEGKFHGLHRAIFHDKIRLSVYKDGVRLAYLAIDHDFKEFYRQDPYNYLAKFTAEDLKK